MVAFGKSRATRLYFSSASLNRPIGCAKTRSNANPSAICVSASSTSVGLSGSVPRKEIMSS
eukprot:5772828-Pleurochrysis_carterae.AAC.1